MDKEVILTTIRCAHFSDNFIQYVEDHFPNEYERLKKSPYKEKLEENPLLEGKPKEVLIESLAQLIDLRDLYIEKNIPLNYLYQSIHDLSYRIERYFNQHGHYGLSKRDIRWLTPIYRFEIFDMGPLRFQISYFSFEEIERSGHEYMHLSDEWKKKIPAGTPIITLHIMKGAAITDEKVTNAFTEAISFFQRYFPEHNYRWFVCRTWLLYEPLQALLPKTSNITAFAKRFTIIAQNQNTKQALERIYGTSDIQEIESMNKTSSLQEKVYQNLHLVGEAAGIIDSQTMVEK